MRLSEGLSALTDQMRSDQAVTKRLTDAQIHTQRTLERFVDSSDAQTISLDDVSMAHLRNMDLSLRKLLEDQNRASEKTGDLLRSEMKMLARTLAAALDRKPAQSRPTGSPQGDEGQ
ncbi:hypothetical protein JCM17845_24650 [Iodidimonas gelatinilytica]|nr:hypothetical protein [Iodidimonas gelatinilytica]GER01842.1 hypothetical protein JCM17845_24650 [Iodidimonas gelatinilytica]